MWNRLVRVYSVILPHADSWASISRINGPRCSLKQIYDCVRLSLIEVEKRWSVTRRYHQQVRDPALFSRNKNSSHAFSVEDCERPITC
ncbi:hypothetical protein SFUMM280S_02645 [Streptomyces fumanus]